MTIAQRIRNVTKVDGFGGIARSPLLPLALLLLALSTVFAFGGDRGHFYRVGEHNEVSSHHLAIAVNLSPEHGFQRFMRWFADDDGVVRYVPYNRFPIGGYASMKLATLPFGGSLSAQIYAARVLMLLFFAAAAVMAYLSLCRLTSNRWIALTAVLLAFSSFYPLYYNDVASPDLSVDLFGVMLTFHGMVVFVREGRFRQLLVKTCIALLLGWHVYALLLPFVVFGLASELWRARSSAADSTPPRYVKLKRTAAALLRSRYLLLGVVALALGVSILIFNFGMEYAALNGETPLTEMPSFNSMLRRTSADRDLTLGLYFGRHFLKRQFETILRASLPYSLHGVGARLGRLDWLSNRGSAVVLGIALSSACLIGVMFVRQRMLFATLASSGFIWALPMRDVTVRDGLEGLYYIGVPLVFFSIVLLVVRRLTKRGFVIASASVAALLLFAVSSFQISRVGYTAESIQAARTGAQDLLAIRELTAGEPVTVLDYYSIHVSPYFAWAHYAVSYYLNSSPIRYTENPAVPRGFIIMPERLDTEALRTPQNQYLFLYDAAGLTAWYASIYRSLALREPLAGEDFDVYIDGDTLYYVKEPCDREDTRSLFFLHVYPIDMDDLSNRSKARKFNNLDFQFTDRGLLFDGKCLSIISLPQYGIAGIRTGRLDDDSAVWSTAHVIQGPKLLSEYDTIVSGEPVASADFDVYLDEGTLYYVKEPCGGEDVQAGFFLHIVPKDNADLPDRRREYGFDNLDFPFDVRGVLSDGRCVASVGLPQYDIARITTGQFDADGRIWEGEFDAAGNP